MLTSVLAFSQKEDAKAIIERNIELLAETNGDEGALDYTDFIDDLTTYLDRPLDLNTADKEDLFSLGVLNEIQINDILAHRARYGRLIALEELQSIPSIPMSTIQFLRVFAQVGGDIDALRASPKEIWDNADHEFFFRTDRVLEEQKGFRREVGEDGTLEDPDLPGSPWRKYFRYRFKYQNRVSFGVTAEQDAGEQFFRGGQRNGFDFYSAHAFLSGFGTIDKLAIGDYQVQFGQGLAVWSGLAFGKSPDLLSIKRNARGISAYRSVDENRFLRGAAVTLKRGDFDLTIFGSDKKRDANILTGDTLDIDQAGSFSSLQVNGFHRTEAELADKNALRERVGGGALRYHKGAFSVGAHGIYQNFDKEFDRTGNVTTQFDLNNGENHVIGADYDYVRGNVNVFGEVARSANGGTALVQGGYIVLDPKLTLAALYRSYSRDFQGPFSIGLGENSRTVNEKGLYMGIVLKPDPKWKLTTWVDRFEFPWLRFATDAPSSGYEVLSQLDYDPSRALNIYFRYRVRQRPRNGDIDVPIDVVSTTTQQLYRAHVRYDVSKEFKLQSRIEVSHFEREGRGTSRGYLAYQDISYRPQEKPYQIAVRYALFDTDGFDSRLYAYEQDVLYFFSIPAHSGVGSRWYTVLRYKVSRKVDVWAKYARFHYRDRDVVSSGFTEIAGPIRSDFRLQVRVRL